MRSELALALTLSIVTSGCGGEPDEPASGALVGDPAVKGDASDALVDVTSYDYRFDLATRRATVALRLRVRGAGSCVGLPMRTKGASGVRLAGAPARSVSTSGGRLRACTAGNRLLTAGETSILEVTTTVPEKTMPGLQVGYSVRDDVDGEPFSYLQAWVGECDRLGPCDNRPGVFATYRFTVTHPVGTQILCPGVITPGATETTCDFVFAGGPTYSTFAVLASPNWTAVDLGDWDGVRATLYEPPGSGMSGAFDVAAARGFLAFMERHFGPYPYGDALRFAAVPLDWAGFEHAGNIALADTLASAGTEYRHTMLHELAHQWAGDQTTLADTYDFVWKESMAEYLSFVYEEEKLGDASRAALWKGSSPFARFYPVPAERPTLVDYYGDVYNPGPMALFRQLEVRFGRSAVLAGLARVLGRARTLSVRELQAALEATTGVPLRGYFDAWILGRGTPAWPQARITRTNLGGGRVQVSVTVSTSDGVLRGPVFAVRLTGAGGRLLDVPFDFTTGLGTQTVTVNPTFIVTGHTLDPDAQALVFDAGRQLAPRLDRPAFRAPQAAVGASPVRE